MKKLIGKIKKSLKLYSKQEIERPDAIYDCKSIQLWKIRISWYKRLIEGRHYRPK